MRFLAISPYRKMNIVSPLGNESGGTDKRGRVLLRHKPTHPPHHHMVSVSVASIHTGGEPPHIDPWSDAEDGREIEPHVLRMPVDARGGSAIYVPKSVVLHNLNTSTRRVNGSMAY
mmetsp:Transcript_63572/g.150630  ORF Transcript_63572/g.150630 Transcript_63572/m.150630 type:complete len:116 (+) Transcript_63572:514-861(+)